MSTLSKIFEISEMLNAPDAGIKKSGIVSCANTVLYRYYELSDFLPALFAQLKEKKLFFKINYLKDKATLEISDEGKTDIETFEVYYNENITNPLPAKGKNPLQQMGEMMTYLKRYLLVNAFNLCEDDSTEQLQNAQNQNLLSQAQNEQKNTCIKEAPQITEICEEINNTQNTREKTALINKAFKIIKQYDTLTQQTEPLRTAITRLKKLYFDNKEQKRKENN